MTETSHAHDGRFVVMPNAFDGRSIKMPSQTFIDSAVSPRPCFTTFPSNSTRWGVTSNCYKSLPVSSFKHFPRMILDNGRMRNVGGSPWRKEVQRRLATLGLAPIRVDKTEDFNLEMKGIPGISKGFPTEL